MSKRLELLSPVPCKQAYDSYLEYLSERGQCILEYQDALTKEIDASHRRGYRNKSTVDSAKPTPNTINGRYLHNAPTKHDLLAKQSHLIGLMNADGNFEL